MGTEGGALFVNSYAEDNILTFLVFTRGTPAWGKTRAVYIRFTQGLYELSSKLRVSPLINPIILPLYNPPSGVWTLNPM